MKQRPQLFGKTLFVDVLLYLVICLVGIVMLDEENTKQKLNVEEHIASEGKYVVIMTWPDQCPDDVDLHVVSPLGHDLYYGNRETDLMHLDHDDLGTRGDSVESGEGITVQSDKNEERSTIRGIIPGEYTVNIHMYTKSTPAETAVTVVLYRLTGKDTEVVRKTRMFRNSGEEQTAFRFTLNNDESVTDINELPRTLIQPAERTNGGGMY